MTKMFEMSRRFAFQKNAHAARRSVSGETTLGGFYIYLLPMQRLPRT